MKKKKKQLLKASLTALTTLAETTFPVPTCIENAPHLALSKNQSTAKKNKHG